LYGGIGTNLGIDVELPEFGCARSFSHKMIAPLSFNTPDKSLIES
jgi:hypothetical protein